MSQTFLQSLDGHSPISPEFRIRTISGATLSLLTILLAVSLITSEYRYNLASTATLDHVRVIPQSVHGLEVEFDITFPHIACALLAVDANDPTGQSQSLHIDRGHRVWKHRLDSDGRVKGKKSPFELGRTLVHPDHYRQVLEESIGQEEVDDEEDCGSCYGAGEEGECCNTCDDVKRAYRKKQWHISDLETIRQCRHLVRAEAEQGEGCNIYGFVALSTGGGNLHFAPDREWEKEGDRNRGRSGSLMLTSGGFIDLSALMEMFSNQYEQFNVSHTVNKIVFGPKMTSKERKALNLTSQLEGVTRTVGDGYAMIQYYLQVVPTVFRFLNGTKIQTFQYSVTEHTRHVEPGSNRGLPGVFFFYEVSALHVEFEEYRRGWTHFFTGVCAAVGGAFTVLGMVDRLLFQWKRGGGDATLG